MYFSLPINHVALQLSTHGINGLCCFRERRGATLDQEILLTLLCLCFVLEFPSQRDPIVLEVSFVEREKYDFCSKIISVHTENKARGTKQSFSIGHGTEGTKGTMSGRLLSRRG